jgi:Family of unknown function (DUF6526)
MSPTQDYGNHPHRPWLTIVTFAFTLAAIITFVLRHFGQTTTGWPLGFLIGAVTMLALISRRYTTLLQDRIIKIEMRLRADRLLSPADRDTLWTFTKSQIVALRFASDAELPGLVNRTKTENLTADQIKRAIQHWQADWDRT